MKEFDFVILGAGAISLSIALYLSKSKKKIAIIEKENSYGMGVSSFKSNSSVIHAGIYYKKNSLKSKLCLEGKKLIMNFCREHKININKCGKIIFAHSKCETNRLEKCILRAKENGLEDLYFLEQREMKKMEPNLNAYAGVFSPSSAVFDSRSYLKKIYDILKSRNVFFFFNTNVSIKRINRMWHVFSKKDNFKIYADSIINAAGIKAPEVSKKFLNYGKFNLPNSYPVPGYYLLYKKKNFITRILYTAIEPGVIEERVDATPMIDGNILLGPSVEKIEEKKINIKQIEKIIYRFYPILKKNFPSIELNRIYPYSYGVRPKIKISNKIYDDFYFKLFDKKNWLDILGIESPGLTSSLAIGNYVKKIFLN